MRVELVLEGRPRTVDVDLAGGTVRSDGTTLRFRVVRATEDGVELEVEGERVVVAGWPAGVDQPMTALAVNGERVAARVSARSSEGGAPSNATTTVPPPAVPPTASAAEGPGAAIVPPMPGKLLEVRVHEGERVTAGQVLVVIEAMKMRNEIVAPSAGTVRKLTAVVGANVAARVPLLFVEPA